MAELNKYTIHKVSVLKSALIVAIVAFVAVLPFALLAILSSGLDPWSSGFHGISASSLIFLVYPFVSGLVFFVVTIVATVAFNLVSTFAGGVDVHLSQVDESTTD